MRDWKREHKLALRGAVALGGVVGAVIGAHITTPAGGCPHWVYISYLSYIHRGCYGFMDIPYWGAVALWSLFGAAVGGSVIFIRRLEGA